MVGERFTSRNRLAQMLMSQEQAAPPIQSHTQGLASLLRQGLAGYMQGADRRDRMAAQQAMMQGMQAKPWVDPDTGKTVGTAGGLAGSQAALQGLPDNEYAADMMQNLQMQKYAQDQALRDYEDRLKLKQKYPTAKTATTPSTVAEWEYFNNLSKPDQERFLNMKRAAKTLNLGGSQVVPMHTDPTRPAATYDVTPKPEQMPAFKGAQTKAIEEAKSGVELTLSGAKKAKGAREMIAVLDGINEKIDQATGGGMGAIGDEIGRFFGYATEGAKGIAKLKIVESKLMESVPRMEGPQSDKDVEMYKAAAGNLGNPYTTNEEKKAAVEMIVSLQRKYAHMNEQPESGGELSDDDLLNKYLTGGN